MDFPKVALSAKFDRMTAAAIRTLVEKMMQEKEAEPLKVASRHPIYRWAQQTETQISNECFFTALPVFRIGR